MQRRRAKFQVVWRHQASDPGTIYHTQYGSRAAAQAAIRRAPASIAILALEERVETGWLGDSEGPGRVTKGRPEAR